MNSRRSFLKTVSALGIITAGVPFINGINASVPASGRNKLKLRIALASDGHYGQPDTDYRQSHNNIISWLNAEHKKNHLDFVVFNGDLVHDRPDLLNELKSNYLARLHVPYYAVPGNHDFADAALWQSVFGYPDNHAFESENIAFIMANTSNTKGEYICPDNNFLKAQLEKYKSAAQIFVVLHIPPHKWMPVNTFFVDCPDTLALLHGYSNVKAVFHGHDHNLDSVYYTNKLPHFFDGHYGGSWGTNYYGYRILEVNEKNEVSTYQVNASSNPVLNTNKI